VNRNLMRQGQQNRRGGGRGRKPQNALARNYESNGPDVRLRGTAAQIAGKYLSLARDALASGDLVAAESYFQHAEHYNRIIMATQSQMGAHNSRQSGGDGGDIPDRRVTSLTAGMVVEICRGSGASMSVPREVTGPRPITMLKPIPTSQTRTAPIR